VAAPAGLLTEPAKKTVAGTSSGGIELLEAAAEPEIEWNKYPAALQTLRLAPREVRNLRLNRPVARLEIVRKNKVQAVLRSPMDLTLLGVQEGTTLIVFHPVDPQAAPWSLAFQVELVQQSIQACYPNSEVKLRQGEQGELVVEGTVPNESVARDILSMVRQLCLVPVQDEIVSQSK
jgi:Flp pilus assembly secretin CpaC